VPPVFDVICVLRCSLPNVVGDNWRVDEELRESIDKAEETLEEAEKRLGKVEEQIDEAHEHAEGEAPDESS
jgi:hypothetical protein